jgi:hypothetical protein
MDDAQQIIEAIEQAPLPCPQNAGFLLYFVRIKCCARRNLCCVL